jgi:hypothetical protein
MNRVHGGKYSYARYLFTNRSEDILGIFRGGACDAVGVTYRDPKPGTVSIARRPDILSLDSFIGPKS